MARLHDVPRGIPHEEFVRRKRRERRLDRGFALAATVPWPSWSGAALIAAAAALSVLSGPVVTGSPAGALAFPAILAVLLAVVAAVLVTADLLRARTRAGRSALRAAKPSVEGPKPLLLLLIAVAVVIGTSVGVPLVGGSVEDVIGTLCVVAPIVPGAVGLGIVYGQLRARVLGGRRVLSARTGRIAP